MENLKVINEKENPLFGRKEIKIEIKSEITPKKTDVSKLISEKFSSKPENILVKKIAGKFGSKNFTVSANIYNSKKERDEIELRSKKDIEADKVDVPSPAAEGGSVSEAQQQAN